MTTKANVQRSIIEASARVVFAVLPVSPHMEENGDTADEDYDRGCDDECEEKKRVRHDRSLPRMNRLNKCRVIAAISQPSRPTANSTAESAVLNWPTL